MCLVCPVSNNFRCFTVNGLQVLCLTDCGSLLPACGLDNCDWWVFSTSKVSVVWAFWLSGTSNPMETLATARLLEQGTVAKSQTSGGFCRHTQKHAFVYIQYFSTNTKVQTLTRIRPSCGWAMIIKLMIYLSASSSCHYCVAVLFIYSNVIFLI